jgi:hypothetical protein
VAKLHESNIRFQVIGDVSGFPSRIQALIRDAEALTRDNTMLTLHRRRQLRRALGHPAGDPQDAWRTEVHRSRSTRRH